MDTRSLLPFSWLAPTRGGAVESNPFLILQREMDRLFQDFGRGVGWEVSRLPSPKVDITETPSALVIAAELPGMTENDIDVTLNDNVLTIRGEKKEEKEEKDTNRHLVERSYGSFQRAFQLPPGYDAEQVQAAFDKGVLKITLPKPKEEQSKVKKIEVKPGSGGGGTISGTATSTGGGGTSAAGGTS